jgi:hypothetical protein
VYHDVALRFCVFSACLHLCLDGQVTLVLIRRRGSCVNRSADGGWWLAVGRWDGIVNLIVDQVLWYDRRHDNSTILALLQELSISC